MKNFLNLKMLICLLQGYASGLPLLLTLSTLQAWMTEEGFNIKTIGYFALTTLPYSWKFIWAPIFDRFTVPVLGRRKGWLLITQLLLLVSITSLYFISPKDGIRELAIICFLISFFSASQDIVIDSYRREFLTDVELGLGSSMYVYGYRVGMLVSGALALYFSEIYGFNVTYFLMALFFAPCILVTLFSPEPEVNLSLPTTLRESILDPFTDFLKRNQAYLILLFILFYKLGDSMAGNMTMPLYLKLGFSKTEIASVVKIFGLIATLAGTFFGGVILIKSGIIKGLFYFGILQIISTLGFSLLYLSGKSILALATVISFENLSSGMGTAAFVAYMASITNKKFTATQYALLTSIMGIPRTLLSAPTGILVEQLGWLYFFIFCGLIGFIGLYLIKKIEPANSFLLNKDHHQ